MQRAIEFDCRMQADDLTFDASMQSAEAPFDSAFDALQVISTGRDYTQLDNKPQINAVTLIGNKTSEQLDLQGRMDTITNTDIEDLLNAFV